MCRRERVWSRILIPPMSTTRCSTRRARCCGPFSVPRICKNERGRWEVGCLVLALPNEILDTSFTPVILTLPDAPALKQVSEDDLRLELACALHARGRISKVEGAKLAGVD